MLRPFLQDYTRARGGDAMQAMASAALTGDHNGAVVHAARYALLNAMISDMEAYCNQEQSMQSLPLFAHLDG